MDSLGEAVEFQRDSEGTYRNGDGHLHLRKDVDGEMATPTYEETWMTTPTLEKMRRATSILERMGMATFT
jgi:hypothetical protein